jgi:hypothetical protein
MLRRVILLATMCMPLFLAHSASAQSNNPSGQQGASLSGTVSESAGTVTGAVGGLKPETSVSCTIASTPTLLGSTAVGANGRGSVTGTLPGDIAAGTHTLSITGTAANGDPLSLTTQVLVSQAAATTAARNAGLAPSIPVTPSQAIPRTGRDYSGLLKIGVMLVAIGGCTVLITRRRRTTV